MDKDMIVTLDVPVPYVMRLAISVSCTEEAYVKLRELMYSELVDDSLRKHPFAQRGTTSRYGLSETIDLSNGYRYCGDGRTLFFPTLDRIANVVSIDVTDKFMGNFRDKIGSKRCEALNRKSTAELLSGFYCFVKVSSVLNSRLLRN